MSDFEAKLAAVLADSIEGFGELVSAERLSGGASQETYRVVAATSDGERTLALRRAAGGGERQGVAGRPGLRGEATLMRCARAAGIPEPEVVRVLALEDGLGEGFLMEWLEGETLGARIVRSAHLAEIRPKLAFQCGEILARIHAIDLRATGLDVMLATMSPRQFIEQTWNNYKAFETPQPMIDYAGRWLMENLPAESEPTLVHNDFRNGNLMIGPGGVVAVLDWEVAHIGDGMRDVGWICTNSWRFGRSDLPVGGFGRMEDLLGGYASVSGRRIEPAAVKYWMVFGSFWWAVGTLGMAQHFRTGPDPSVERAAIGRRTSECQVDCANLLMPGPVTLIEPRPATAAGAAALELPRLDELLASVREYLRQDVMGATSGRLNFLARVAGNSLDVVLRDLELGEAHRRAELERLRQLFDGEEGDLGALRWRLTRALRDGSMPLDRPNLREHLRTTVVQQLAIDQPKYSGLAVALAGG